MEFEKFYDVVNSQEDLPQSIDGIRKQYTNEAKSCAILEERNITISPYQICDINSGRVNIEYKNSIFEAFFNKKEKSTKLYVFFSGSRTKNDKLPLFKRWSYSNLIDSNVLSFADPMFRDFNNLNLGWYYGTKSVCYPDYIAEIISICAEKLNISSEKIFFFSSSGGGFPALYCSCKINGSTCTVINPQIKPALYFYKTTFEKITNINLSEKDQFERNNLPELIAKATKNKFLLIENLRSNEDMTQLNTICDIFNTKPVYGINKISENIFSWVYDADYAPQHNAQDWRTMFLSIDFLSQNLGNYEKYDYLYKVINEFWYEHYIHAETERKYKRRISTAIFLLPNSMSNAVFNYESEYICDVAIPEEKNNFNFFLLYKNLKPNTIYSITISKAECTAGKYTLLFKDTLCNYVIKTISKSTKSDCNIFFSTGETTDKVEFRIYPNEPGKTQNIGLKAQIEIISVNMENERRLINE